MCTTTLDEPKLQIAKKNIVVYKKVDISKYKKSIFPWKNYVFSDIKEFKYILRKTYKTKLEPFFCAPYFNWYCWCSGSGFYSFKDRMSYVNVKCIIPKGSRFYLTYDTGLGCDI